MILPAAAALLAAPNVGALPNAPNAGVLLAVRAGALPAAPSAGTLAAPEAAAEEAPRPAKLKPLADAVVEAGADQSMGERTQSRAE